MNGRHDDYLGADGVMALRLSEDRARFMKKYGVEQPVAYNTVMKRAVVPANMLASRFCREVDQAMLAYVGTHKPKAETQKKKAAKKKAAKKKAAKKKAVKEGGEEKGGRHAERTDSEDLHRTDGGELVVADVIGVAVAEGAVVAPSQHFTVKSARRTQVLPSVARSMTTPPTSIARFGCGVSSSPTSSVLP